MKGGEPVVAIGARRVGPDHPTYVVAEMSGNHAQSYERALAIVRAAAAAGADAVKLQAYTADTITIDGDAECFRVRNPDNPEDWRGKTLHELYRGACTPYEWFAPLQVEARRLGLELFATPFDLSSVDFLEDLGVPCYKIASYEVPDLPLLRRVAATHKPAIISVGFASWVEVEEAVRTLRAGGAAAVAVLHCVTLYAADPDPAAFALATIADLRQRLGVVSGFSDNNAGIEAPIAAVLAGASIIEKHLTVPGPGDAADARFSLDPEGFRAMVAGIRRAEALRGRPRYGPASAAEAANMKYRRSLFVVADMAAGEAFTPANLRSIRPADGLPPRHYDYLLGRRTTRGVRRGTPLSWALVEGGAPPEDFQE